LNPRAAMRGVSHEWRELNRSRSCTSMWDALRLRTAWRHRTSAVDVHCSFLNRKISVRPATSDLLVAREVFGEEDYLLPRLDKKPRFKGSCSSTSGNLGCLRYGFW
jgi:hypothetical protein